MAFRDRHSALQLPQRVRQAGLLLGEAATSFSHNRDLRQASSLAFYTTLALIPALLLLTVLLSLAIGSSLAAVESTTAFVTEMLPSVGEVILREVSALSSHPRTASLVNLLVLTWSLTPLVGCLREVVNGIFKVRNPHSLWLAKTLDLMSGLVFIVGLAAVAGMDVFFNFLARSPLGFQAPAFLRFPLPFAATVLMVWGMYRALAPRAKAGHLLAGALTTALLWFLLRPAFTLFLTHDQGYGFTFGSLKSVFIVTIWIYYSMAVLLFGAEVAAALHREDRVVIKRLMKGRRGPATLGQKRFLMEVPPGHVFFREGEPGDEMYYLIQGAVSVRKGGQELARLEPGQFFGEMTFLLGQERSATVEAVLPCECVIVHQRNFDALLHEYPGLVREMLVTMAQRLRDTSAGAQAGVAALSGVSADRP